MQLSESVDARLIVDVACRRGQELGSVLEERGRFDLILIMAGTNDLAMGVAPDMVLHSIQALHAECQMGGVRTLALRVPQSFFTFEDPSFGALSDEVKQRLETCVCHTTRRMVCGSPTACTFRRLVHESLAGGWQLV